MPQVTCSCGSVYHANDAHIGKKLKCGKCGRLNDIVRVAEAPPRGSGGSTWRQYNTGPNSNSGPNWTHGPGGKQQQQQAPEWEVHWQDPPRGPNSRNSHEPPPRQGGPRARNDHYEDERPQRSRRYRDDDGDEAYDSEDGVSAPEKKAFDQPAWGTSWDSTRGLHPFTRKIMIYAGGALFLLFLMLAASVWQASKTKDGVIQMEGTG